MLRSFVTWLDGYLAGEGLSAVIKAIVGLLSFAALAGVVLGSTAIRAGALVAALFFVLATILILLRDRKRIKEEAYQYRQLLSRYCNFLTDRPKPIVRIRSWDQVAYVEPNGDTKEIIHVNATVLRDELYFLQFSFGPRWEQPASYRKRVKLAIRVVLVDGTRGPDCDVTSSWMSDGGMDVIAHLHSPAVRDTEIRLEIEWHWPGKCLPLMRDRKPDEFTFNFRKFTPVEQANYVVVLPVAEEAYYYPIGFVESNGDFAISSSRNVEGKIELSFSGKNLPIGRRIGMRLQLK